MNIQEKENLQAFISLWNELQASDFYKNTEKLTLILDRSPSAAHRLEGYDENSFQVFLMGFRKIISLNDSATYFPKIANIISKEKPSSVKLVRRLKDDFQKKNIKVVVDNKNITIVDAFFNGSYFHEDKEKKEYIKDEPVLKKNSLVATIFGLATTVNELATLAATLVSKPPRGRTDLKNNKNAIEAKKIGENKNSELKEILVKIQSGLDKKIQLSDFERARMFLLSASLLYYSDLNSEVLDNHELNLAYRFKDRINCLFYERWTILRTLISDTSNLKAGWYWLKSLESDLVVGIITTFTDDVSDDVKRGSVIFISKNWRRAILPVLKNLSEKTSREIKKIILTALKDHSSQENLPILEVLQKDQDAEIQRQAFELRVELLIKSNFVLALDLILNKEGIDKCYIHSISRLFKKLTRADLKVFKDTKAVSLKIFLLKELIERKLISVRELEVRLKENQWEIRYLALMGLINRGVKYTALQVKSILNPKDDPLSRFQENYKYEFDSWEDADILKLVYSGMSFQELESSMDWSLGSVEIYEFIGKKFFPLFAKTIREDLGNNFIVRREALLKKSALDWGVPYERLEEEFRKYDDLLINNFLTAAMNVLLEKGTSRDVIYAKDIIKVDDHQLNRLCIKVIKKYGSQKDSQYLLNMALKKEYAAYKDFTLGAALHLGSKTKSKIFEQIMRSDDLSLKRKILAFATYNGENLDLKEVINLLHSDDEMVRENAVAYLDKMVSRVKKEEILNTYQEGRYFYNVVCWLDRVLYAPRKIYSFYKKTLDERISSEVAQLEESEIKVSSGLLRSVARMRTKT